MAKKPIMRSCTIQTTSSIAPSTPNATSSPSVNVLPHDGPVAIALPRSVDMSLQEATRLPTARIAASALLLRDGIFGATFVLHDNSAAVSPSSRSHLVVDIRGKCLQLRKSPSSSVSNETATSSGSPPARRSSMIGASSVTVYSNDILGVARVPSDTQRLTVMLSSGAPLQLRFPSTQSREWAYEYLKLLQSTNTVDVVSHVYLGLTPGQKAEDKVLGDAHGTATSTRRVQFFAEEENNAAPVKQLIVDASSMTLAAPPATNTTSTSTTTTVTVFHDASHWHDIRLSIIVSTVTVDDPVPAELQADSNVSQEVDIIVAALQVAKSAHQYQEAVDGERSVSPGAEVESTIARTTIVSKALQDVLSRNQSTSPLTVESSSSIYTPLSPKGSKTSLWTAAAAAHKFVVALVNEEESDMIYFVLVRKELIYAIQHLRLMAASHDVVNTVGAKCSTVSLQVNETSIGFMFTRALNSDNKPQAAVSLAEIVPQVLSQSSQSVPEAITQGSTGSTAGGGGALELLDPCCQWHFMFVIKPRIHEPVLILPEGQISHQFIGRDATITLLHAANIEHRSAFLSTYGQIATTSATVPLHRFTLRTTRSHATILHPLSSTAALVPSSSTISYPTRRLSITSVTLKLTQDLSELSSPWSPNNIFTSTTTTDSATSSSAVNIELESVIGAAPLSLALAEDNDEQHLDGEKRFTSQGPVEFEYLVSCNTCCAEALLKIREQPVSTSNKRRTQIAGSASTSLLPLLNASVHAPSRIVAPWFVQGREVGYITIEGNLL
ncbi:Hypothetical protein, putative [Bodo saltans]|uniref:Uncharacterized protein n=1 Tax=Bodo saltans TaxID=75058 RepID=A0A0S4IT12_BODSA|nr:Hypothetical protein, putative [Bodo saltans]|eukprot:CUG06345.1 Hypothetical protein, putative [Bodo saltans]